MSKLLPWLYDQMRSCRACIQKVTHSGRPPWRNVRARPPCVVPFAPAPIEPGTSGNPCAILREFFPGMPLKHRKLTGITISGARAIPGALIGGSPFEPYRDPQGHDIKVKKQDPDFPYTRRRHLQSVRSRPDNRIPRTCGPAGKEAPDLGRRISRVVQNR